MSVSERFRRGDLSPCPGLRADAVVQTGGCFGNDERAALSDKREVGPVEAHGTVAPRSHDDADSPLAEKLEAAAGNERIRIRR